MVFESIALLQPIFKHGQIDVRDVTQLEPMANDSMSRSERRPFDLRDTHMLQIPTQSCMQGGKNNLFLFLFGEVYSTVDFSWWLDIGEIIRILNLTITQTEEHVICGAIFF